MGGMNVAMTIISLILIEKAGRKTLMLSGLGVMLISTTCLLICLLVKVKKLILAVIDRSLNFVSKNHSTSEIFWPLF